MTEKEKRKIDEQKILTELVFAQDELNALKREHGIEEEEKGIKKLISALLNKREVREKVLVNKKKYTILAVCLGFFGGHRFYAKQYVTAVLYLLLCWTGISVSMTIIDLMVIAPMKADEDGNVLL